MPVGANLQAEANAWRSRRAAESGAGGVDYGTAYVGRAPAYDGASRHGAWFAQWPARLQSADRDTLPNRAPVNARARDLYRNSPVARAAVSRRKNAAVGRGWRLSAKPNARLLKVTPAQARELGQHLQAEFNVFAYGVGFMVDAERRFTLGQLLRVAASHLMLDGEFFGLVEWAEDEPTRYQTRLRLVDPDRVSTPLGQMDGQVLPGGGTIRGGVETSRNGVPVAYHIRERHPADVGFGLGPVFAWDRWERYATPLGRPQVLHGLDPDRAGQTRGISQFASALKSFRGFDRFTDATIQSAALNALILGYVQSGAGPDAISENFQYEDYEKYTGARDEHYAANPVEVDGIAFPTFPNGDEPKFLTDTRDVTSFDAFTRAIVRLIAASLGVTYEEVSMDYSSTNYSSARAALIHAWAETQAFMAILEYQLVRPLYVAWLEEHFDKGYAAEAVNDNWPSFYDAVDAYATGRWLGPGRGYIDPTKEILAAAARIEAGISTLEDECAEQGKDYEEVMEQTAFEQAERIRLGIQPLGPAIAQSVQDTKDPTKGAADTPDGQVAPEDARPGQRGALGQIAAFAHSAEHEAALDARPVAA